jgi:hypothetical protein
MGAHASGKNRLKDYLDETDEGGKGFETKPIADLFPPNNYVCGYCWLHRLELFKGTVAGVHSPRDIYQAFDEIARRRRVFKVETIGDCYVAVCGLPTQKGSRRRMARFARDCLTKMNDLEETRGHAWS